VYDSFVLSKAGSHTLSPPLEGARAHTGLVVFCGHLFMLPLAAVVAKLLKARLWV
jgi:hypothetical protein